MMSSPKRPQVGRSPEPRADQAFIILAGSMMMEDILYADCCTESLLRAVAMVGTTAVASAVMARSFRPGDRVVPISTQLSRPETVCFCQAYS